MNFEFFEEHYFIPAEEEEHDIYFYHTDHLGSSSWITYSDGSVTQHMQNLPFGKPFIDQRATSYDIRYKFTGKEMDTETGYQYFGARYYNSDISVWLSVDPMSDEYLSTSPYMYVLGNPIIFIDPNGMNHGDYYDSDWNYIGNDGKKDGKIYVLKDIYSIDWDNKDINYKGTLTSDQSENLRNISERRDFVTDNNDFSFSKNDRLHPDNFKNNHNPFSTPASDYKPSPLIKGPYDKSFQNLSYNTKQFAYDLDQSLDYTTNGGKIPGPLKFISDLNPLYNVPSTLSAISTGKDFFGIEYNKAQRFISKPLSLIIKIPKVGKSLKIDDPVSQHIFNTITNEATRSKKKN
jgi:RHS repeat-associated protein